MAVAYRLRWQGDVRRVVRLARALILLAPAVALVGCATGMRTGQLGPLGPDAHLVTLVVTDDPAVVRRECPPSFAGAVLGCQTSRVVQAGHGRVARAVKIVRYAESLPSRLSFDVDIHELCHAIASVQPIDDPCHIGNGGVVQGYPSAAPRSLILR